MNKKKFQNFLRESARDFLSLGSIAFLILVVARALTGQHNEIVFQLIISSIFLIILSFFIRNFEYHLSIGFILLVFTIIFYDFKPYKIFSIIVYFFMVISAFYLGKNIREIFKGVLLGIISSIFGYFLSILYN